MYLVIVNRTTIIILNSYKIFRNLCEYNFVKNRRRNIRNALVNILLLWFQCAQWHKGNCCAELGNILSNILKVIARSSTMVNVCGY